MDEIAALKEARSSKVSRGPQERAAYEDVDPEYISYYQDMGMIDLRLGKLENILKNAVIIEPPGESADTGIRPGAVVVIEREGKKDRFKVTGSFESDPARGRISAESPVGAALLGHRAGEKVTVPDINAAYRILEVSYPMA